MGNIVLLDDLTINKIAAGEVIERPASVVKELVENSIDAGATNINVEIKNGGISYIRVTDNGKGLMQDDMEIAFERHATSKIRQAQDLETVKSMGFRGEALASIAAIAKVEMKSKTQDSEIGYQVVVEGGNVLESSEIGCPQGTTITVENLFFNTPVRYKFLKKDFTESGYIEDIMTRIALIHPEISVRLISSGKTIIQTTGNGSLKDVVYSIYGKEIAENVLDVDYQYEDIRVTGVVGKPSLSRSNRSNQLFYINKRFIKDKNLTASSEQAFKGMITIGKFGFLILNLDMNPQKVDVNVHPAKLEVRFEEEGKVFKAVYHAIKDTLLKGDLVSNPERSYDEKEVVEDNNGGLFKNNKLDEKTIIEENNSSNELQYDKSNIIADLYAQRNKVNSQNIPSSYASIINKMAEMQKNVEDYKKTGIINEESEKYSTENDEIQKNINIPQNNIEGIQNEYVPQSNIEGIQNEYVPQSNIEGIQNDMEKTQNIPLVTNEVEEVKNTNELKNEHLENSDDEIQNEKDNTVTSDATHIMNIDEIIRKAQELKGEPEEKFNAMYSSVFGTMPVKEQVKEEPKESAIDEANVITGEAISLFEEEANQKYIPRYKFIGIAFSTYIIIELDNEIYIIDQHAAHERILYEKIKENYYSNSEKDSQLMLLPDIINLTHKEMDILKDNINMFERAGFTLEEFGENTIKLTGVPNICLDLDTKELFLETLDEINTVARTAKQEIEERFIATVACKAAVKANMALTKEEVDSLMETLLKLPNPFSCPHGRPTAIRMSKNDIERKFSRR